MALDNAVSDINARKEGNLLTWLSTSAAFAAAFAAAVHALVTPTYRRRMAVICAVFAYCSLDDFTTIHERFGNAVLTDAMGLSKEISSRLELLSLGPLLGLGLIAVWSVSRAVAPGIGRRLRMGLLVLAGAFALELVAGSTRLLLDGPLYWIDELRIGLEEGTELAGWIVVATALVTALCATLLDLGSRERAPAGDAAQRRPPVAGAEGRGLSGGRRAGDPEVAGAQGRAHDA